MKNKAIIYVPGLNDDKFMNRNLTKLLPIIWKGYGFSFFIISPKWNKGRFKDKLRVICNMIDQLQKDYDIYLIGQSAGGAAVLNAYAERRDKIKRVVNICGRLKKGEHVFPSLEFAAKGNPAFAESVLLFERKNRNMIKQQDKRRILILKPIFDEVVPKTTIKMEGSKSVTLPVWGHSLGGITALTIFSKKMRDFFQ